MPVQDVHEAFFVRQVLEVAALRVTLQNYRNEEIKPLITLFSDNLDQKLAQHDYEALFQSDVSPHNFILRNADNRRLSEFLAILGDQIERIRRASPGMPGRMEVSVTTKTIINHLACCFKLYTICI
ncbi:MAG: FCD domain-containing protein [Bacteroidota bacterium]